MERGPRILLAPSLAAVVEWPRRIAAHSGALTALYPTTLRGLARTLAEPHLLGRGLLPWDTGHDALLAARLLEGQSALRLPPGIPLGPVARTLARTLSALRMAGIRPERVGAAVGGTATEEDRVRLRALGALYRLFDQEIEGRFADPATLLREARARVGGTPWLRDAEVLVVDDLEIEPLEAEFLEALARALPVRRLARERPRSLVSSSFGAWAEGHGVDAVPAGATLLGSLASPGGAEGLVRLREALFDAPSGVPCRDGSLMLLTAAGEAKEVRAVVRALLREAARGVPFEEMGVILPRPTDYAPLFTDLLERLGIPHRLHPSLPLRYGRCARSLLLLFRCRGLPRKAVMEFLTFSPIPFSELLGEGVLPRTALWDALSREAGIVSGLDRWMVGLRSYAEAEQEAALREGDEDRRARRLARVADAEALLRLVELLSQTLDALAGEASWGEWAERLQLALDQWIAPETDREAVREVLGDLAGLGSLSPRAPWRRVEDVLEARLEWERLPLPPLATGAVHVGALDALAGLPFRVVAIPGLVEGGYPGVIRPDPFLLDGERESLARAQPEAGPKGQMSLFEAAGAGPGPVGGTLPTSQDRLLEARRLFHRAVSQARERLILSYPRADARTGRERLPSLFFVAAASVLEGRPLGSGDLETLVVEDEADTLDLDEALDAPERDRIRLHAGGRDAALAIAAGSAFFRQSHLSVNARWSPRLTPYDGLVAPLPPELAAKLDPLTAPYPLSASRLAVFARCGFMYFLQHVLRLEPALEPEERKRLEPLERGSLFHEVAERFLRELRDKGELPVADTPATLARLLEIGDAALDNLVAGSPPRFGVLWERERRRFRESLVQWLGREAASKGGTPAHFEVAFGVQRELSPGEPHSKDPLTIDLGDSRVLRVSGQIDRIDRRPDGTLVLRDYKTGRAPKDDGGVFRGGQQLQIPFYILAAAKLFPGERVAEAFLDYVDGGRQVALDPEIVTGEGFRELLRGLVDAIAQGVFLQEPSWCDRCDFTAVCGPKGLLERRRHHKISDRLVQRILRLRDIA